MISHRAKAGIKIPPHFSLPAGHVGGSEVGNTDSKWWVVLGRAGYWVMEREDVTDMQRVKVYQNMF